jgi:DNA-binding transcriptional ArsR family regulator
MDSGHSLVVDEAPPREHTVAATMHLFSAPSRVRILSRLLEGACSVNELANDLGMERAAVSKQLRVLSDESLVHGRRRGQHVIYSIPDEQIARQIEELTGRAEELAYEARRLHGERTASELAERLRLVRERHPDRSAESDWRRFLR